MHGRLPLPTLFRTRPPAGVLPLALTLALVAVLAPTAAAQKGAPLPELGLELVPPKGWIELPPLDPRGQLRHVFAAPRAVAGKAEGNAHTPVLQVFLFENGAAAADADLVDGLPRRTPFRDLDDWVHRGHGGHGRVTEREPHELAGIAGHRFTAIVNDPTGDRTLHGVTLGLEAGELVVAFDAYADHFERRRQEFDHALETLRKFAAKPATAKDATAARAAVPWLADPAAFAKLDAAAQANARREHAHAAVAAARAHPGFGWKEAKTRAFTVLSAAEPAVTSRAIAAAEAARAWCEATLPGLVAEPLPAVLRVLASPDHWRAMTVDEPDMREYSAARRELYFHADPDAGANGGYGMLFRAVLWHYLDDADPGILPAMPRWLDNGFWEYLRSTRLKGKQIVFSSSDVESGRIDYQQRANSMPALWHLMQESMQPSPADGAPEDRWGYTPECARLVRWLVEHDGAAALGDAGLLPKYLKALGAAWRSVGPNPVADVDVAASTEAQAKVRNERYYEWRDAVLHACNMSAVPLQEPAWRAANEKWLRFNATFK